MVKSGVEVIIPAGRLPSLLFSRIKNFIVGGALVLNGIAVLAKMSETAIALNRFDGTIAGRLATVSEALAQNTAGVLGQLTAPARYPTLRITAAPIHPRFLPNN
jgi:hypothetical protein